MTQEEKKELLRDRRVVEEIGRHQWIESEKLGYDIGFERAAEDWLERFSKAWMRYHMPKKAKDVFSKKSKTSPKPTKKTVKS